MTMNLEGKAALVTGAGRGIGRAIAHALAESGAAVMVNDLDDSEARETAASVRSSGGRAESFHGDVTKPGFPDKLIQATLDVFSGVDILVNNAGYTWDNVIQKTSDEQFQAMLDVHAVAPFRLLRAASGFIRESAKREIAEGRRFMRKVVNITSISGMDGNPGQVGYGAGKAAVVGLTKSLAKEWGRFNVNVNCVGFGIIETRLTQPLGGAAASIQVQGRSIPVGVQPAVLDAVKARCPLGRFGTAEEAAGAVLFFCSSYSDYVTGEVLMCSGGLRF